MLPSCHGNHFRYIYIYLEAKLSNNFSPHWNKFSLNSCQKLVSLTNFELSSWRWQKRRVLIVTDKLLIKIVSISCQKLVKTWMTKMTSPNSNGATSKKLVSFLSKTGQELSNYKTNDILWKYGLPQSYSPQPAISTSGSIKQSASLSCKESANLGI